MLKLQGEIWVHVGDTLENGKREEIGRDKKEGEKKREKKEELTIFLFLRTRHISFIFYIS